MLLSPSDFRVKLERTSNSSQSTRPTGRVLGKNYSSFLDFTRNSSGIFVPRQELHYKYLQDECFEKNYSSFLDFTCNYERMSGIFCPLTRTALQVLTFHLCVVELFLQFICFSSKMINVRAKILGSISIVDVPW